jgi:hypothetical protein
VWSAPTTTDKDRKRLLRSLLDEVNISVCPGLLTWSLCPVGNSVL